MQKTALIEMIEDISDAEKKAARKTIIFLKQSLDKLSSAKNYLNTIYIPFKDNQDITPENVNKFRFFLRKYRDKSVDNFNEFKIVLYKSIVTIQRFSSDSDIFKLTNSLITAVENLENLVNDYADLFKTLDSKEFTASVVKAIDEIFKQSDKIEVLIKERVIEKINDEILSKTWVDSIGEELNIQLKEREPSLLSAYNKE